MPADPHAGSRRHRQGLGDIGHRLTAHEKLCVLLEKTLAWPDELFKQDAVVAMECFLSEERER
jgi:hypothetical protein